MKLNSLFVLPVLLAAALAVWSQPALHAASFSVGSPFRAEVAADHEKPWRSCLPSPITADTVVRVLTRATPTAAPVKLTVGNNLKQLKATCRRGVLVDGKRRPIRFYALKGCWGNPPANYLDINRQQEQELKLLKRRYTVIQLTCDPTGGPPPA